MLALLCVLLVCGGMGGCLGSKLLKPGGSGARGHEDFRAVLSGHEMELEGNPVAGFYLTTSGVMLSILEDGKYSWDETRVGGQAVAGTYEIFEGTLKDLGDGTTDYVYESDTGPVYTLWIEFDRDESGKVAPFTIQVFDYYNEDVYRVTDIVYGTVFEATDLIVAIGGVAEFAKSRPSNFVVKESEGAAGPEIVATWDELPGADEYRVVVLSVSLDEFTEIMDGGGEPPEPILKKNIKETEITIGDVLSSGKTYTVAVWGYKGDVPSVGAYNDITLK